MAEYDYNDPTDTVEPSPDTAPPPQPDAPPAPPAAAAPEIDPGLVELEELRRSERGRRDTGDLGGLTQPRPETPGTSPLTQDPEESGWMARFRAVHAGERERGRQDAIRESAERAERRRQPSAEDAAAFPSTQGEELYPVQPGSGHLLENTARALTTTATWLGVAGSQIPGGAISGVGAALQLPDVALASREYAQQELRLAQIQAMEDIDRGASVNDILRTVFPRPPARRGMVVQGREIEPPTGGGGIAGAQMGQAYDRFAQFLHAYRNSPPELRERERSRIEAEFAAFRPTPIQERGMFRAGEAVSEFGRTFHERIGLKLPEG